MNWQYHRKQACKALRFNSWQYKETLWHCCHIALHPKGGHHKEKLKFLKIKLPIFCTSSQKASSANFSAFKMYDWQSLIVADFIKAFTVFLVVWPFPGVFFFLCPGNLQLAQMWLCQNICLQLIKGIKSLLDKGEKSAAFSGNFAFSPTEQTSVLWKQVLQRAPLWKTRKTSCTFFSILDLFCIFVHLSQWLFCKNLADQMHYW